LSRESSQDWKAKLKIKKEKVIANYTDLTDFGKYDFGTEEKTNAQSSSSLSSKEWALWSL
jgi:hypothetical protein